LLHKTINNKRCLNLTGETSLTELIQLFHFSDLLITNDGGAAQFSGLTDINAYIFFGPETAHLYKPLGKNKYILQKKFNCSPCLNVFNFRNAVCGDGLCVNSWTPDELFDMIKTHLTDITAKKISFKRSDNNAS